MNGYDWRDLLAVYIVGCNTPMVVRTLRARFWPPKPVVPAEPVAAWDGWDEQDLGYERNDHDSSGDPT